MARQIAFVAVACLCSIATAIPTIAFPFNSQVPPVARVSELFQYTFSSSTFSSTLPMSYTLLNAPSWLSLDSSTRTLTGTPSAADVGPETVTGVNIGIVAQDATGSITSNATLVISKNQEPEVKVPFATQLPSFGSFSFPSTVLYHPSTPFTFTLDQSTFQSVDTSSPLSYYAVTDDNTPLPSWIRFDQTSFTFSGQTPDYASLVQPPQTFGVRLVASDVEGFAGTSLSFDIKVGVHLFAFKNADMKMVFTTGVESTFNDLANNLLIDDQVATPASIASVTVQTPPWMSFDSTSMLIKGTPTDDAIPSNITVQATDVYGDTATANILIDISSAIFTAEVGVLNATAGSSFSFDLGKYLRNPSDVDLAVEFDNSISWIQFDSQTLLLSGNIPADIPQSQISMSMQATSRTSQITNTQKFLLSVIIGNISTTTSPTQLGGTPTGGINSPSATSKLEGASGRRLKKAAIAGIVIAVIAGLALLLFLLFLCYRRRRRGPNTDEEAQPPKLGVVTPNEATQPVSMTEKSAPTALAVPLNLDTTGFGNDNRSSVYSGDLSRNSTRSNPQDAIRRSRTYSGVSSMSGGLIPGAATPSNRARSYSENILSRPGMHESTHNRRYTQDSSYPVMRSRANSAQTSAQSSTKRLSRTYSNYSRKGHTRRAGRIWNDQPVRNSLTSIKSPEIPILNLKDSNFSAMPLANFTVMARRSSAPKLPEVEARPKVATVPTTRRNSKLMSPLDRTRNGIGHGSRDSIDSILGGDAKRRSLGHGQEWPTLKRDSRTWLTMDPYEIEARTRSNSSQTTGTIELPQLRDNPVRSGPGSSPAQSPTRSNSRQYRDSADIGTSQDHAGDRSSKSAAAQEHLAHSRPISRRIDDSTPFFSGRTESVVSRKSPKNATNTHNDSVSLDESSTIPQNRNVVRVKGNGHDSMGSTATSSHESTRQLRSYLQTITRNNTKSSIYSTESRDSRFESASPSMQSLRGYQRDEEGDIEMRDIDNDYEEFLPDNYSDASWDDRDSQRDSQLIVGYEDSQPNIVMYGEESQSNVSEVNLKEFGARHTRTRSSTPISTLGSLHSPLVGTTGNARIMRGRGRRPVSVDTGTKGIGSVRGVLHGGDEEDE